MELRKAAWFLAFVVAFVALVIGAGGAQVSTTNIVDTIYRADGSAASGSLLLSWPEFTTVASQVVPAGKVEVTIGTGGSVNFALAANAGALPAGTYYTVVYHLGDGTVSTEYWTVPQAAQISIAAVRSAIIPATVAVQSASTGYVNGAISEALTGYLPLTGGTLSGPLYLSEDPLQSSEAATKNYVDTSVASTSGGSTTSVTKNPTTSQTVNQPAGTTLSVNNLQNLLYAAGNQTGVGNNGISNSMALPGCQSGGCVTIADPGYSTTEEPQSLPYAACFGNVGGSGDGDLCGSPWPINSRLFDQRSGTDIDVYQDPIDRFGGLGVSQPLDYPGGSSSDAATAQFNIFDFDTGYGNGQLVPQENLMHQFAGGHNGNYGSGWGKSNLALAKDKAVYFSQGQHSVHPQLEYCLGLGDCMGSPMRITFASGLSAPSDEGIHHGDAAIVEDPNVFQGSCTADGATGASCAAGSTLILACIAATGGNPACNGGAGAPPVVGGKGLGDQGEGRMAIDVNQASAGGCSGCSVIAGTGAGNMIVGQIIGGNSNIPTQLVSLPGTFTPSTGIATLNSAIVAATGQGQPGPTSVSVTTTSGTFGSGVACITDYQAFEQINLTSASATSITASFRKPHLVGALLTQGGTCGWGLAMTADSQVVSSTVIRTLLPLLGSPDDTHTYINTFLGSAVMGLGSASVYNSLASGVAATYSPVTNLVTVTGNFGFAYPGVTATGNFGSVTGSTLTISGASDPNYNGSFMVTVTSNSAFTYIPNSAPISSSVSGLTVVQCSCSFTMYPRAEVLSVYNQVSKLVDGTLVLEPNNVNWLPGDMVEEPHWHQPAVNDTHDVVITYTPQSQAWGRGYNYSGIVTGSLHGFDLRNVAGLSEYQGFGGSHTPPTTANYLEGWWNTDFTINSAPNTTVASIGCKPSTPGTVDGCNRWNAGYDLWEFAGGPPAGGNSSSYISELHFEPSTLDLSYNGHSNCRVTWGDNVGSIGTTTYGGSLINPGNCALFTPRIVLGGGTALTSQTGAGFTVVTDTGPTINAAILQGSTAVPAGQTLAIAGSLNITGTCSGCGTSVSGTAGQILTSSGTGSITATSNPVVTSITTGALAGTATGMTFTPGTAAGSGATSSCYQPACDSVSGVVQFLTGTAPSTSGTLLTVGFGLTHSTQFTCVTSVFDAGVQLVSNYGIVESTSGFALNAASAGAFLSSTAYRLRYICAGRP